MRTLAIKCFRVICVVIVYILVSGLSIISLNYQSPEIMEPGEKAFSLGVAGALLNGSFDPVSEELQLGARFGRSEDTEYGIKVYISSGEGRIARGFGIYGDGKFFGFEKPLFTLSSIIGFSYSRCRLRQFEELVSNDMFGFYGSIFLGKRLLYGGFRENIEFVLTSSGGWTLSQHIAFFIGGMIGKKHSVIPEICYYHSGLGRDYDNARNDFVVGLGYQYTFR
jgi:hypothetical protein